MSHGSCQETKITRDGEKERERLKSVYKGSITHSTPENKVFKSRDLDKNIVT